MSLEMRRLLFNICRKVHSYCLMCYQQSCWISHTSHWWLWHFSLLLEKWNHFSGLWWHCLACGTDICSTSHAHNSSELMTAGAQAGCEHTKAGNWETAATYQANGGCNLAATVWHMSMSEIFKKSKMHFKNDKPWNLNCQTIKASTSPSIKMTRSLLLSICEWTA